MPHLLLQILQSIVVFTCLGPFLMRGSYGQTPTISLDPFRSVSDLGCIRDNTDMLILEGTVEMNSAEDSQWVGNGVQIRSPQTLICTASLQACPPTTHNGCYCELYDEDSDAYTVRFVRPADEGYSQQPITMRMDRSDFGQSVMSGAAMYPYVNEAVGASVYYGSKRKFADIDGTTLDVPNDDQMINMTISGLRRPFTITYGSNGGEVTNTDHVSIPITSTTNFLIVRYKEQEYCERGSSYSFTITSVQRQSPHLDLESLADPVCPVNGQGEVALQATVEFTGGDVSDWSQIVYFRSGDNQEVCSARLNECPPSNVDDYQCYCQQRVGEVFTIRGNAMARSSLSGKAIHMAIYSSDSSVLHRGESLMYPSVASEDVQITLTYTNDNENVRYSPPTNNSRLGHPRDNQQLTFTANGLIPPFSITYVKLNQPVRIRTTSDENSVTFSVDDDTEMIQVTYDEDRNCNRRAVYVFYFEDDSSDDLSTGAIVGIVFGGIFFVVIIIFFVIVYQLVRAREDKKGDNRQPVAEESTRDGRYIIDYSSKDKDVESGGNVYNGPSYDNTAYVSEVPANSGSVVMNPVYNETDKENEYNTLDAGNKSETGPSYESLGNGMPAGTTSTATEKPDEEKPTETSPAYIHIEEVKPADTSSGVDNADGETPSKQGPFVTVISTSL